MSQLRPVTEVAYIHDAVVKIGDNQRLPFVGEVNRSRANPGIRLYRKHVVRGD